MEEEDLENKHIFRRLKNDQLEKRNLIVKEIVKVEKYKKAKEEKKKLKGNGFEDEAELGSDNESHDSVVKEIKEDEKENSDEDN